MKWLETLRMNNWKIGLKSEKELLCWQKFWIELDMKCLCRLAIRLAKYSIYWEHISNTWPEYRQKMHVDIKNYFYLYRKIKGKLRWYDGLKMLLKMQILSVCSWQYIQNFCHCLACKEICISCSKYSLPQNSEEKELMSSRGREDAH